MICQKNQTKHYKKKNIKGDNGGAAIRVTKTRSKHIGKKEEEKERLSVVKNER